VGSTPEAALGGAARVPGARAVTTLARAKRGHMEGLGDVLVDGLPKYRASWEEAGGVFVHHRGARETLDELAALGLDIRR
jgi:hypothetical protein